VASVAVTVSFDEPPATMEAGSAAMVTAGAAGGVDGVAGVGSLEKLPDLAPPHPASARNRENSTIAAKGGEIL
jgi:hypothetical protein